ncbi:WD repeat-containing protein 89 [Clupea harengus]|uniref:WD repeat-containing protein 89 n=1 Tax=Clupea harengus TaxID=7950 RepID=A0A6P8GBR8_CLUHA|nr:WD repeat-containing protein 89 [Clupea harengus]
MESLEETFKALAIARRTQPSEPTYILDVALQPAPCSAALVAVSCSNRSVRLHHRETLGLQGEFKGHTGPLCGVRFAHASPTLLYSGSADGTLRCWDTRCPGGAHATRVFRSDPAHVFCSFDVSSSDVVLCAGTEQVGEDSFLVFWDTRKPEGPLGVYSESHSDDITAVRFHPRVADRLASGGMDGLVNVFDVKQGGEEDALITTCNSGSSTGAICWAGVDGEQLLCLTHDEGLHLWDVRRPDSDDPLTLLCANDARSLITLPDASPLEYFVGGAWLEEAGQLLVVGGTRGGGLHLLDCSAQGVRVVRSLADGHSATVRCFAWEPEGGALLTGGEDGQLLQWRAGATELQGGGRRRDLLKSSSALQLKARTHRKHHSKRNNTQHTAGALNQTPG